MAESQLPSEERGIDPRQGEGWWQKYLREEASLKYALKKIGKWYRQNRKNKEFTILIIGETGSGKSTLINNIAGEEVATVGHGSESETSEINKYSKTINGVNLVIYDSPGDQDSREGEADQKHMTELKERLESNIVDLVIFCYKMSNIRLSAPIKQTFRTYHNLNIPWEKTIFAITFANKIDTSDTSDSVQENLTRVKTNICTFLKKDGILQISDETVDQITFCPTGRNPEVLLVNYRPGEKYDWFTHLWFTALERLDREAFLALILLGDRKTSRLSHRRHGDGTNAQQQPDQEVKVEDVLEALVGRYKGKWKYKLCQIIEGILEDFRRSLESTEATHSAPPEREQEQEEATIESGSDSERERSVSSEQDAVADRYQVESPNQPPIASTSTPIAAPSTPSSMSSDIRPAPPVNPSANPLPPFIPLQQQPFKWGDIEGVELVQEIRYCYSEVVHFRQNLFKVPTGRAGNAFVKELARLFIGYGQDRAFDCVALKAAFALPALVLQKPHPRSKSSENRKCLLRRLDLWQKGQMSDLLTEGKIIQNHLFKAPQHHRFAEDKAIHFCNLVKVGKLHAAQRLLQDEESCKPLTITQEVKENLQAKHPPRQPPTPDAILPKSYSMEEDNSHIFMFDQIDGKLIHKSALKSDGAAGPSGLDAAMWKHLCSSFGNYSADLCTAIATVARRLCTTFVDPESIEALVASRLIALDKCPGIRPIGVGEVIRRIIGRAILAVLKEDIMQAVGPLQLCAGQEAGCEAAIHALHQIYDDPTTDAILQVDATNAFNSLNRETALRNIHVSCPALATILINTYRQDIPLFIGGETILSQEGTTQGDPLAMAMYALAVSPLIKDLSNSGSKQVWYADDSSAGGRLGKLRTWWESLQKRGPAYGYFINSNKSWLVVKEDKLEEAKEMFQNTGLNITSDGRRHLGSAIGAGTFTEVFVQGKVAG